MVALLRSELFRLRRRPMTWVLLIVLAALVVLLYLLLWTVVRTQGADDADLLDLQDSLRLGRVWETGLGLVQTVGTILVVILAEIAHFTTRNAPVLAHCESAFTVPISSA